MSTALAIRNDATRSIVWTDTAHQMIAEALECSALIGRVTNADENDVAVEAHRRLRACKAEIEKVRKILKEPIIEFGRAIDATAKKICEPLDPEEMRIAGLLGNFQELEAAKRRAAEAARLLEQQQIERERAAELARIAREEAARQQKLDEEQRKAQQLAEAARSQDEAEKAAALSAEIERQKQLAEAQSLDRMAAVQEKFNDMNAGVKPIEGPIRAKGQVVRTEWEIEEINTWELAKARPDLVRSIEFDRVTIKALLNSGVKLPGVKAKPVVKSSTLSGKVNVVNV